MTSKILQAKNEKQLKELARLSENKRCAICTCMGTQFTCQPPSIFVCSTCAGAIYHFPGFRVKSRSMATYTAAEVQQMKQGGNAAFARNYLAKWNASTFPAPTDKNPKKVEEFIKQVLVDKVFYLETPLENKPVVPPTPAVVVSQPTMQQQVSARSLKVEESWNAFSADEQKPAVETQGSGGNWAEFPSPSPPAVKPKSVEPAPNQPFDPFAPGSPIHASPKSMHSAAAMTDPFATQSQQPFAWEAFKEPANGVMPAVQAAQPAQAGWSAFDPQPTDPPAVEKAAEVVQPSSKARAPVMDPLPEEWFSVDASLQQPSTQQPGAFHAFLPAQQPPFPGVSAFGSSSPFQPSGLQATGPPQPFAFSPQPPRSSLGAFPSFRSTGGTASQPWTQPQGFQTMQKQDSMQSYVSQRVDETAHHPLFENLDKDMRAKAHSVAGMPIQPTAHSSFFNGTVSSGTFVRPTGTTPTFEQSFMQHSPQTGFQPDTTGNPFA